MEKFAITIIVMCVFLSTWGGVSQALVRVPLYDGGIVLTHTAKQHNEMTRAPSQDPKEITSGSHTKPIYYKVFFMYVVLGIGAPVQSFKVAVDTGEPTSDLWVVSPECNSVFCQLAEKYHHNKSTTYTKNGAPFALTIADNNCSGYLSQDVVNLGGVNITSQVFGEATNVYGFELIETFGILGLGSRQSSVTGPLPLFYNMLNEKLINEPVFGMYLTPFIDGISKGELLLGGRDPAHYEGDLTYINLSSDKQWEFTLSSISVTKGVNDTVEFCHGGCNAIMETATSDIVGPIDTVDQLNHELGAFYFELDNFAAYCFLQGANYCSKHHPPPIVFHIGGKRFELPWEQYTWTVAEFCCTRISGVDIDYWALGGTFLRAIYTEFDAGNSRLGFAKVVP